MPLLTEKKDDGEDTDELHCDCGGWRSAREKARECVRFGGREGDRRVPFPHKYFSTDITFGDLNGQQERLIKKGAGNLHGSRKACERLELAHSSALP